MKRFKKIDFLGSCALIIGSIIWGIITSDERFLIGYFIVGGWQVISMLVHGFMGWFCKKGTARSNYHWIVLLIIAIALLGIVITPLLFIFLPLLFSAPFMAIWYASMCYEEIYVKMQRPMALLK